MKQFESLTAHYEENHAISIMADHLREELMNYIKPSERPYFLATLDYIARDPDNFRRSGYSTLGMRFCDHERHPKTGKVIRCKARYVEGEI